MKRFWICAALLLLLVGVSAGHVYRLSRFTDHLERQVELTQHHLAREDWEDASQLLASIYGQWEDKAFYLHTTLRHADIDAIRTSFREALAYTASRDDPAECAAVLERLRNQLELLIESELPTLKNLL